MWNNYRLDDKQSRNNLLLVPYTLKTTHVRIHILEFNIHVCTCNHYTIASETQKNAYLDFGKYVGSVAQKQTVACEHLIQVITACCSVQVQLESVF